MHLSPTPRVRSATQPCGAQLRHGTTRGHRERPSPSGAWCLAARSLPHGPRGSHALGLTRQGYPAAGYRAAGYRAAGYRAAGYRAAGYRAAVYRAAGYRAAGYRAAGYRAAGYRAAGYRAAGYRAARNPFRKPARRVDRAGLARHMLQDWLVLQDAAGCSMLQGSV
jgi:hypothetical protein